MHICTCIYILDRLLTMVLPSSHFVVTRISLDPFLSAADVSGLTVNFS